MLIISIILNIALVIFSATLICRIVELADQETKRFKLISYEICDHIYPHTTTIYYTDALKAGIQKETIEEEWSRCICEAHIESKNVYNSLDKL
jgi:hypothetical protein